MFEPIEGVSFTRTYPAVLLLTMPPPKELVYDTVLTNEPVLPNPLKSNIIVLPLTKLFTLPASRHITNPFVESCGPPITLIIFYFNFLAAVDSNMLLPASRCSTNPFVTILGPLL
jgi:hypothetical protein